MARRPAFGTTAKRAATFGERWAGTWTSANDPAREREIDLTIAVSVRPSRERWPVCAEIEGHLTVEGWFARSPITGVAEIARLSQGLCLRYMLENDTTRVVVARRLDPRDPYGSLTVLVGTVRLAGEDVRALLRADPRAPADVER